jgi:hypothetical protein
VSYDWQEPGLGTSIDHRRKRAGRAGVPGPENEPTMTGQERERPAKPSGPANPEWEAELRAGLEADGGVGSVEPELAIARLLVHAHRVETLDHGSESRIWTDIERVIRPAPWWKRRWFTVAAPAAAAAAMAAVLIVVIARPDPRRDPAGDVASSADLLEQQFELLAPKAREDVSRTVDANRGQLRGELIAMAMAEGGRSHGGAP